MFVSVNDWNVYSFENGWGVIMVKLHIGCGKKLMDGYCNIDTHLMNGADMIHWLPKPLLFLDVEEIRCHHVIEDFTADVQRKVVLDFLRVLKLGGVLHLKMPHRSNKCFVGSVYHMKPAVSGTFNALVKNSEEDNYSEPERFSKYLLKRVNFHRMPILWFTYGWWNELLVNSCPALMSLYEFSIWSDLFPAHECEWRLQK